MNYFWNIKILQFKKNYLEYCEIISLLSNPKEEKVEL